MKSKIKNQSDIKKSQYYKASSSLSCSRRKSYLNELRSMQIKQSIQFGSSLVYDITIHSMDDTSILQNNNSSIDDSTQYRIHMDPNDFFMNGRVYADYTGMYIGTLSVFDLFYLHLYNKHQSNFHRYDCDEPYKPEKIETFAPTKTHAQSVLVIDAERIFF